MKSNKAYCLLLKGDLKEGFRCYENRFKKKGKAIHFTVEREPVWNGEDIRASIFWSIRNRDLAIPSWRAALSSFLKGVAQKSSLLFRGLEKN